MIRPGAFLVGVFFAGWLLISFVVGAIAYVADRPAQTAEQVYHLPPKSVAFSFDGPFGHYDKAQLQRGFQVFKEVCSACHGLKYVAFRDLSGLGYNDAEIKAIAQRWAVKVPGVNPATGETAPRNAVPVDHFPDPFANAVAARAANNGALPPDLSLITKARRDGPAYVYSLLTGYKITQPADMLRRFPEAKTPAGLHYNPYFASLNTAMVPPLSHDGQVQYAKGQPKPTVDQMARDVSAFLAWSAEPKMENRKSAGVAVVLFLLIATGLAFMSYRTIRAEAE